LVVVDAGWNLFAARALVCVASFHSEGSLARNKDGTICSITVKDPARIGRDADYTA